MGTNFKHHLSVLSNVLEHFQEYNIKLKPKKCLFFQDEITFLGKRERGSIER
jgi:hypothetical protein